MKTFSAEVKANMEALQQSLRALRQERGLTQVQLGDMVGVSQPFISQLERGHIENIEIKTLMRLAAALGASVDVSLKKNLR